MFADDHEIFRDGFKVLLRKQNELELIAEAEGGKQLIELVKKFLPDIIFLDIQMPDLNGIEACKIIKELFPDIGVIALSMFNEDHLIVEMLEAGARGYLLKNTYTAEVVEAAKAVYQGETYYCRSTSTKLTNMIADSRFNPYRHKPKIKLTPRELEIIKLLYQEYSNKEIANVLNLSIRTVESYRENIQEKIGAKNSVGIIIYALKNKLVSI